MCCVPDAGGVCAPVRESRLLAELSPYASVSFMKGWRHTPTMAWCRTGMPMLCTQHRRCRQDVTAVVSWLPDNRKRRKLAYLHVVRSKMGTCIKLNRKVSNLPGTDEYEPACKTLPDVIVACGVSLLPNK